MRFIDLQELGKDGQWPPEGWEDMLREAEAELEATLPGPDRSALFEKYSQSKKYKDVWAILKKRLRDLSHDKCWYCETSTHRMPNEIDHHRPKSRVTNSDHPGYWWLMFDWHNFRFTCKLCNSRFPDPETKELGGKGNHFPLLNGENDRIRSKDEYQDYEDLLREIPMLLDPVNLDDPSWLTFDEISGKPVPLMIDEETFNYKRAKISIEAYHLDYEPLNRARRRIYHKILRLVRDYERYQKKWEEEKKDYSAHVLANRARDELKEMLADDAPYSSAARAYLGKFRKQGIPWHWVNRLLDHKSL